MVEGGVVISVRLQPAAGQNRIDGIETAADGRRRLKVRVTAVAEKGRANQALVRLLAKAAGLPRSALAVTGGHKQRNKQLLVRGAPGPTQARLQAWLASYRPMPQHGERA